MHWAVACNESLQLYRREAADGESKLKITGATAKQWHRDFKSTPQQQLQTPKDTSVTQWSVMDDTSVTQWSVMTPVDGVSAAGSTELAAALAQATCQECEAKETQTKEAKAKAHDSKRLLKALVVRREDDSPILNKPVPYLYPSPESLAVTCAVPRIHVLLLVVEALDVAVEVAGLAEGLAAVLALEVAALLVDGLDVQLEVAGLAEGRRRPCRSACT